MLFDKNNLEKELKQTEESFKVELKKLRSGRANPEVVENVMVEAYDSMNKLNTLGQVVAEDAMTIKVTVWDKSVYPNVEKALREANLGGGISVDKDNIRIKFNPMTDEDRQSTVKELNRILEDFRVRVRQIRQKYMKDLESLEGVSEDDQKRDQDEVQKLIDASIKNLEKLSEEKENDLLKI